MTNSDLYILTVENLNLELIDTWCGLYYTPVLDTSQGGENSINIISLEFISDSTIQGVFTRSLDTNDSNDKKIVPDVSTSIIWAYVDGTSGVTFHYQNRCNKKLVSAKLTFATKASNFQFDITNSDKDRDNHGRVMTIAWGVLASVGIIAAKYFKAYSCWFLVHFLCLMACSILTIASSKITFEEGEVPVVAFADDNIKHSRIGHILAALVVGQVVFGMLGSYFKLYTKNTSATLSLLKLHKLIGYAMFIAGLRNLYLGWDINKEGNPRTMAIIYIPVPIIFIGLELYRKLYSSRATIPDKKLKEMNHFEVMDQVKSGKKLMFADELVIDVSSFSRSHPGGSFMISKNIGEDAGKYMVGCSSYGGKYNAYAHSKNAFAMLKKLSVGRIAPLNGYLTSIYNKEEIYMNFVVKEKKDLNSHTRALTLSSPDYKVSTTCKEPSWLGKHFMFMFMKRRKITRRYYSAIFVDVMNWSPDKVQTETQGDSSGEVKFIFKVYSDGKMTNYIDKLNQGESIMIRGPLGPGLLLSSLNGSFLALAGGTGLVPFIDLVDMAFRQFGKSTDQFKLSLFVFFRTYKDGFALDSLKNFSDSTNWLELVVVTDEHPNKKGIPDEVKIRAANAVDLAWVCGPSGFNRSYSKLLIKSGISREKVIVM